MELHKLCLHVHVHAVLKYSTYVYVYLAYVITRTPLSLLYTANYTVLL